MKELINRLNISENRQQYFFVEVANTIFLPDKRVTYDLAFFSNYR
jgi:hypothetical protein